MEGLSVSDNAPVYTSLADLKLLSRTSSDAASEVFGHEAVSEEYEASPKKLNVETSSRIGETKGLSLQFGAVMAMVSGIAQRIAEFSEVQEASYIPPADKEAALDFFQSRLLELRIWSKDLTACHPSFLNVFDNLLSSDSSIISVGSKLLEIIRQISDIITPFTIDIHCDDSGVSEDGPHSLVKGCFFIVFDSTTHPERCGNVLSLGQACDQLNTLFRTLLHQKSAIRGILTTYKESQGTDGAQKLTNAGRPVAPNVLSFDGGGVRSFSSLLILKDLMERVNAKITDRQSLSDGQANAQTPPLRPADVFEFIYGSSSGGILAIMLGRFAMTVDECIQEYRRYVTTIFEHPRILTMNRLLRSRYPLASLTQATRRVISEFDKTDEDEGWRRSIFACPSSKCKVGVVAWESSKRNTHIFRTYDCYSSVKSKSDVLNPGPADSYKIWEVAMATVAAPTYFDAMKLDGQTFIDGGISTNNPTREALFDVNAWLGDSLREGCVVSIGTGSSSKRRKSTFVDTIFTRRFEPLLNAARAILTATESTHRDVQALLRQSGTPYFRLSSTPAADIRLDELASIDKIYETTKETLNENEFQAMLDNCATVLAQSIRNRQNPNKNKGSKQTEEQMKSSNPTSPSSPFSLSRHEKYFVKFSLRGLPLNQHFVGREDEMERVSLALQSDQPRRRKICVIAGLGGIGKTELAAEYIRRSRDNFSAIFWIRSGDQRTISQDLEECARRVHSENRRHWKEEYGLEADENFGVQIHGFLAWLSEEDNTSWLLVYDDANRTRDILEHMPQADHGSVIITSRSLDLTRLGSQVSLGPMSYRQSSQLFYDDRGEISLDSESILNLLNNLGGFPLAITEAAHFMRRMRISISEFESLFQENPSAMDSFCLAKLSDTFRLSWKMLEQANHYATSFLRLWALISPDTLGLWLLVPASVEDDETYKPSLPNWLRDLQGSKVCFYQTLDSLFRFCMVERELLQTTYSINRVLHRWVRRTQIKADDDQNVVLASSILSAAISQYAHAGDRSKQTDLLIHSMAYSQYLSESEKDDKSSLKISSLHDSFEQHHEVLVGFSRNIRNISRFLIDFECIDEAATLLDQIKAETTRHDKLDISSTFELHIDVARLKVLQGRFNEAQEILQGGLLDYVHSYQPTNFSTLIANLSLAVAYIHQRKFEDSIILLSKVLSTISLLESNQIDYTLITSLNTACSFYLILHYNRGLLDGYGKIMERFLDTRQRDAPIVLTTCAALGRLSYLNYTHWRDGSDLDKARTMFKRALTAYEGMGDLLQLASSEITNNLACILCKQHRFLDALEILQSKLRMPLLQDKFDVYYNVMMRNLAVVMQHLGRFHEARDLNYAASEREEEAGRKETEADRGRTELILVNLIILPMPKDTTTASEGK